jgi:hypothetical protein
MVMAIFGLTKLKAPYLKTFGIFFLKKESGGRFKGQVAIK